MLRVFFSFPGIRGFHLYLGFQELEHQESLKLEKDMRLFYIYQCQRLLTSNYIFIVLSHTI